MYFYLVPKTVIVGQFCEHFDLFIFLSVSKVFNNQNHLFPAEIIRFPKSVPQQLIQSYFLHIGRFIPTDISNSYFTLPYTKLEWCLHALFCSCARGKLFQLLSFEFFLTRIVKCQALALKKLFQKNKDTRGQLFHIRLSIILFLGYILCSD